MLNISNNSIDRDSVLKDQSAYKQVMRGSASRKLVYFLAGLFLLATMVLFLPWTQNIRARGKLTTLRPENREQSIHSVISGRIQDWYVREGQLVSHGDTIVYISEMKAEYLDPELVSKSEGQTQAKRTSIEIYNNKASALSSQITALDDNREIKMEIARTYINQMALKVESDSIDYETALINLDIAHNQLERQQKLYDLGLKSLTELQLRQQKLQEAVNKETSQENKWLASKNEYSNALINLGAVENEYDEKIAKARSERFTAISNSLEAESDYYKLSIQQTNYSERAGFNFITAPQDGYVTRALITGLGETVKAGEAVFSFIPSNYNLALEMYVRPIDLPLVREGNRVQIQFDGWPALVFDGWPGLSFGSYTGQVISYDKAAGPNGDFRVLVTPDPESAPWPELLRLGSGAYGIALLKEVPVWYELWRNLNGFPPDFYSENKTVTLKK